MFFLVKNRVFGACVFRVSEHLLGNRALASAPCIFLYDELSYHNTRHHEIFHFPCKKQAFGSITCSGFGTSFRKSCSGPSAVHIFV